MDVATVDLFCGVGGMTHGFESVGIPVSAGVDINPDCQFPFEKNNDAEFVEADIADIDSEKISSLFHEDSCKILTGCAPCQPFSNLNNGANSKEMDDWSLLQEFGRIIRDIQPEIIAMENVTEIRNHQVYSKFIDTLFKNNYNLSIKKIDCEKYGVPQSRRRLIVLASKYGDISLVGPTHTDFNDQPTVRKTIGGDTLNSIEAGESNDRDPLHQSQALSEKNLERIRQSVPGGTWRDWDSDLMLSCHKKDSGNSYDSVYARMEWDKPAPTVTTQFYAYGSGRFGHPQQDRAISLREGAMLQTFDKSYVFIRESDDEIHFKQIGQYIGNAIPVQLAEIIGRSINQHIDKNNVRHRNTG